MRISQARMAPSDDSPHTCQPAADSLAQLGVPDGQRLMKDAVGKRDGARGRRCSPALSISPRRAGGRIATPLTADAGRLAATGRRRGCSQAKLLDMSGKALADAGARQA